jgi:hypothetical protein
MAEVVFGNPDRVKSKSFELLDLLEHPAIKFRRRPVKAGNIGGQIVSAKTHSGFVLFFPMQDGKHSTYAQCFPVKSTDPRTA